MFNSVDVCELLPHAVGHGRRWPPLEGGTVLTPDVLSLRRTELLENDSPFACRPEAADGGSVRRYVRPLIVQEFRQAMSTLSGTRLLCLGQRTL